MHDAFKTKYLLCAVLCLLVLCISLSGCEPQPYVEITTDTETEPAPSVSFEETTEEETALPPETTEQPPETTEPPAPESADVFVFGYGGHKDKYTVEVGKTLSNAALEAAQVYSGSEDVKAVLTGWEYSFEENGARYPYDTDLPLPIPSGGLYLHQVYEYSFRIRFDAGEGAFAEGEKTEYFLPEGTVVKPSELLIEMPVKADDGDNSYIFLGFVIGGKGYRFDEEITVSESMELVAAYDVTQPVYSVTAHTEYGELIGGGKNASFSGSLAEAEAFIASYNTYFPENVKVNGISYRFVRTELSKEGREWTLELIWEPEKIYTVVFNTDIGSFADGSPVFVLSGAFGDALIPPELTDLTFGEVVYEFAGWDKELTDTVVGDAVYTAVYKTAKPAYRLNLYINGELWQVLHYYAGSAVALPERPAQAQGKIFSGWQGLPELMPESDTDVHGEIRAALVIYRLDGEIVSSTETAVGTLVTVAAPIQKYGYTVSGWTTADIASLENGGFTMPEKDVVFDAVSTPKTHSVIYMLDGVTVYTDSVEFGETYTVRGIEVKRGFEFSGWVPHGVNIDIYGGFFKVPDADVVLKGNFSVCSYKVNYYLDDMLLYSDVYRYGDTVILRPDEVQEGCSFAWASAGANLSVGSFMMPAGDVDIHGVFSDGDNRVIFMIDGEEYGVLGVVAGRVVDIPLWPSKQGYTFTGWYCEEIDVSSGEFVMPEGELVVHGSFIPNTHAVTFMDISEGRTVGVSYLDYGTRFSFGEGDFCSAGRVSKGLVLIEGDAMLEEGEFIMPDSDVIFGIVWDACLTILIEEDHYIPYYALSYEEYEGCRYDESTQTVYISDPAMTVAGTSDGVTVIYE